MCASINWTTALHLSIFVYFFFSFRLILFVCCLLFAYYYYRQFFGSFEQRAQKKVSWEHLIYNRFQNWLDYFCHTFDVICSIIDSIGVGAHVSRITYSLWHMKVFWSIFSWIDRKYSKNLSWIRLHFWWNGLKCFKWKKEIDQSSLITVNQSFFEHEFSVFHSTEPWIISKDNWRKTLSYSSLPTHSLIGAVFKIGKN